MHERTWKEEVQDIHLQVHSMHLSSIKTGWLVWQHTMEESNMSSHYSATVTLQSLVSRTEMDWSNVSSHYSSTMSVHLMKLTTQIEMIQVPPLNNDSSSSFNNLSDDSNLDEKMPPSKQGHLGIDNWWQWQYCGYIAWLLCISPQDQRPDYWHHPRVLAPSLSFWKMQISFI